VLVTHELDIAEYGTRIVSFRDGVVQADQSVASGLSRKPLERMTA
jgi:hypothetical protein